MRRLLLLIIAVFLAMSGLVGCAGLTGVKIWTYLPSSVDSGGGPYTVHVEAWDPVDKKFLRNDDTPVVGEYGPALLIYPTGHHVELSVTVKLGKPIPLSSWIRLQDHTSKRKSCSPVMASLNQFDCKITTQY